MPRKTNSPPTAFLVSGTEEVEQHDDEPYDTRRDGDPRQKTGAHS
jgi:hypothetical protein